MQRNGRMGLNLDQLASLVAGFIEIASTLREPEIDPSKLLPEQITDILRVAANEIRLSDYAA